MRELHYKVRVKFATGKGFIDGFRTATYAKAEVERINGSTLKTGVTATYLGRQEPRA